MIRIIDDTHYISEYLHDESRLTGNADSISFPETEDEIRELAAYAAGRALPLTVQGSRTGITGGAVPRGGHILNLSRMNRITGLRYNPDNDRFYLTAQPGLKLQDLNRALADGK
ncbi:MAG: FAD-binding protein, partial [Spirochaetia bacterium]